MTKKALSKRKQEQLKAIMTFIETYERLPYYRDEDVVFYEKDDSGELVERPLRAWMQSNEFLGIESKYNIKRTSSKLFEYLRDTEKLTDDNIRKFCSLPDTTNVELLFSGERSQVSTHERRQVHKFLGYDLYEKMGEYALVCSQCSKLKKCKMPQEYWVEVIKCPDFKKQK